MKTRKQCVAMLLAGGQGSRLGVLTAQRAKPAVPYGGKFKIIDFPLSNCSNSGIDTVGVLTQYQPLELNAYIGTGSPWDLDSMWGGAFVLPPYMKGSTGQWYSGTANAIYQNRHFIDSYSPKYLLVLSGDHIYKMDYGAMLDFHIKNNADATIAVITVPMAEASRFGIMNTDEEMRIIDFEEKPKAPKNDKASMGVYVFTWDVIKEYMARDNDDESSVHDFGKNVIPLLLNTGRRLFAYPFEGYWKDVGTIESLWDANMELLSKNCQLDLHSSDWRIYSQNPNQPPHYVTDRGTVENSIISEGCFIDGHVKNSVLFSGVSVSAGAVIEDSIVMQDTQIGENCLIKRSILDENVTVGENCSIGGDGEIAVVGREAVIHGGAVVPCGTAVSPSTEIAAYSGSNTTINESEAK